MHTSSPPGQPRALSQATAAQLTNDVAEDASGPRFEPANEPLPLLHLADELLSRSDEDGPLSGQTAAETSALVRVARWAKEFLTKPDPMLGRSGHVCPFVGASIREQRFLLTVLRGAARTPRAADQVILRLGRYFLQMEPVAGRAAQLKTIVVLLPDLPEQETAEIINGIHQRVKPHFLRHGLMLGEFFKDNSKSGLHNPHFRPLRSDTPLLVIRSMVLTDIAFLTDHSSFVRAFLDNFAARGCGEILSYVERQRSRLSESQVSMLLEQVAEFQSRPNGWGTPAATGVFPLGAPCTAAPTAEAVLPAARSSRGRCPAE